jgi:hypothetical protein
MHCPHALWKPLLRILDGHTCVQPLFERLSKPKAKCTSMQPAPLAARDRGTCTISTSTAKVRGHRSQLHRPTPVDGRQRLHVPAPLCLLASSGRKQQAAGTPTDMAYFMVGGKHGAVERPDDSAQPACLVPTDMRGMRPAYVAQFHALLGAEGPTKFAGPWEQYNSLLEELTLKQYAHQQESGCLSMVQAASGAEMGYHPLASTQFVVPISPAQLSDNGVRAPDVEKSCVQWNPASEHCAEPQQLCGIVEKSLDEHLAPTASACNSESAPEAPARPLDWQTATITSPHNPPSQLGHALLQEHSCQSAKRVAELAAVAERSVHAWFSEAASRRSNLSPCSPPVVHKIACLKKRQPFSPAKIPVIPGSAPGSAHVDAPYQQLHALQTADMLASLANRGVVDMAECTLREPEAQPVPKYAAGGVVQNEMKTVAGRQELGVALEAEEASTREHLATVLEGSPSTAKLLPANHPVWTCNSKGVLLSCDH